MSYNVKTRKVEPVKVMSIRTTLTMQTMGEEMPRLFTRLYEYITQNGGQMTGDCFDLYHDEEFNPECIDVECCFSVADFLPNSGEIQRRTVEGSLMASTLHKGPYDGLNEAYEAIMRWVGPNGYVLLPRMRNLYLNDPYEVSPEEILTEVLWPIKKKQG